MSCLKIHYGVLTRIDMRRKEATVRTKMTVEKKISTSPATLQACSINLLADPA